MSDVALRTQLDETKVSGLQSAVNSASSSAAGIWLSFLTFMAYLTMAVGSVNHEALLRESPITLPVLNVQLPLVAFFWIAPIFLLLFHFYIFLQLTMLVRKVATLNAELDGLPDAVQDPYRRELDSFVVVQFLCGAHEERKGTVGRLLRFIASVTLVFVPILLLLQFQLTFLPYHNSFVTWVHRLALLVDLRLIWVFWSAIERGDGEIHFPEAEFLWRLTPRTYAEREKRAELSSVLAGLKSWVRGLRTKNRPAIVLSAVILFASVFCFSYKGEFIGKLVQIPIRSSGVTHGEKWTFVALSDVFLHGRVDMVKGRPESWFSNVLVVPNKKLVKDEDLEKPFPAISLRGRDLRGAVLINSDLRDADFTGANLNDARLDNAILVRAKFGCASSSQSDKSTDLNWPDDECTWLQRASLFHAQLQLADFTNARMHGSVLINANLQGATLNGTQLEYADLAGAQLQGSRITGVDLRYGNLGNANLMGSYIYSTILDGAFVQGTVFDLSYINGIKMDGSQGHPGLSKQNSQDQLSGIYLTKFDDGGEKKFDPILSPIIFDTRSVERIRLEIIASMEPDDRERYQQINDLIQKNGPTDWSGIRDGEKKDEIAYMNDRDRYIDSIICGANSSPYITKGMINNGVMEKVVFYSFTKFSAAQNAADKLRKPDKCEGAKGLKLIDLQQVDVEFGAYASAQPPAAAGPAVAQGTDKK